ncbi:PQQ-binding-like beta-propeller repeat protein [Streptomyces sp. bgisy022]|uniref:outer membrane protein assembly factor BamB family protein n=1 Tax=Streptomyces sp. bgisy022 TaxID=3413769 RepID=UPI003D714905
MEELQPGDPSHMGPFTLHAVLGMGGMATVYLGSARDGRGGHTTPAVVKVLRKDFLSDEYLLRLFRREIAVLHAMNAGGTLEVIASDPNGERPWFATEYVPGMDLQSLLDAHGPFDTAQTLGLAGRLAPLLMRLRDNRIVHRDLKPSNILVLADGTLRLIDFGVVRRLDHTWTLPIQRIGTRAYMAPEQLFGGADHPSDVFSFGLTLSYAATGTPVDRTDLARLEGTDGAGRHRGAELPPDAFSRLAQPLRTIVSACTRPRPAERVTAPDLLGLLADHRVPPLNGPADHAPWLPAEARDTVLRHLERVRSFLPATPPPGRAPSGWLHRLSGLTHFTSPVDAGRGIALCSLDGTVSLVDALDGHVMWRRDLAARIEHTPAAGHGLLYVPCSDRTLFALDTADGSTRWVHPAGDSGVFAPVVTGDRVVVSTRDGSVHCVSARTGTRLWVSDRDAGPVYHRPTVANGVVFVSGWQGRLRALSLGDGTEVVRLPQFRDLVGAPAEARGTLFVAVRSGTLCAVDSLTGREKWRMVDGPTACTGPVPGDDLLFVGTARGTVRAHSMTTGHPVWWSSSAKRLKCPPVYHHGTLYVGTEDTLTAFDAPTGTVRWQRITEGSMHASPLIAHGHVYVGTVNCRVQAVPLPPHGAR